MSLTDTVSTVQVQMVIGIFVIGIFMMAILMLISQRNAIKMVMGTEMLSKSVMLYLVFTGFIQSGLQNLGQNNTLGVAEAMVVIIVVIEAVVTAVALSIIVKAHGHNQSIDLSALRRLFG